MLVQQLINGLMLGSMYALLAIGYTLVLGILNLLNFAHAEVFMVGAFMGLFFLSSFALPIWLAILLAMFCTGVLGILLELICFRPIPKQYHIAPLLTSISFGTILLTLVVQKYGSEPRRWPAQISLPDLEIGSVLISSVQLVVLAISVALMIGVELILHKTKVGRAMRAISEDASIAALLGVSVNRIVSFTFFISSALAGIAGMLVAMRVGSVSIGMSNAYGFKALAVMVIGGMGNVRGAMLGGLLMGLVEILTAAYGSATYADVVVWGVLIVILLLRPSGLFGSQLATRA